MVRWTSMTAIWPIVAAAAVAPYAGSRPTLWLFDQDRPDIRMLAGWTFS